MTIHIELDPELEAQLAAEALAQGVAVELYAKRLLWNAVSPRNHKERTQESIDAFFEALARNGAKSLPPHLEAETFSREMIYGDHP